MAQIRYTAYRFPRPPTPSEDEFDNMQVTLLINPDAQFGPRHSYFREFKGPLIFAGALLLAGLSGWAYGQLTKNTDTGNSIAIGAAVIGFFTCMPLLLSSMSYASMRIDCSAYYEELKRDLNRCETYAEFRRLRESKEAANLYR